MIELPPPPSPLLRILLRTLVGAVMGALTVTMILVEFEINRVYNHEYAYPLTWERFGAAVRLFALGGAVMGATFPFGLCLTLGFFYGFTTLFMLLIVAFNFNRWLPLGRLHMFTFLLVTLPLVAVLCRWLYRWGNLEYDNADQLFMQRWDHLWKKVWTVLIYLGGFIGMAHSLFRSFTRHG